MQAAFLAWALAWAVTAAESPQPPVRPFETATTATPATKLDELVLARLKQLKIEPARLCSDAVFVRRVYLDVIGTLPTADEAREFLADTQPEQAPRCSSIDLLERDEFADYWAMKWCDLLRVKAEFPINLWPNAVQAYHRWIRTASRTTCPTTASPARLLTASGSNFRVPPVNFYRAMQSREPHGHRPGRGPDVHGRAGRQVAGRAARRHGRLLLRSRLQVDRRVEGGDRLLRSRPRPRQAAKSRLPPSSPTARRPTLAAGQDPREVFADWLIAPEESVVRPQHRQPRLVLAAGPRHRPRARRHPARQSAAAIRNCWPTWSRNWSPPATT